MKVASFTILPDTPDKLKRLEELAYNLYFAWHPEVCDLFRQLDEELWAHSRQNPVYMLGRVSHARLIELAEDTEFLEQLTIVHDRFRAYMDDTTWFEQNHGDREESEFAYFCLEFGIHECLPIYAGGLGVLAGDHLKSASDLGLPLVSVGLFYRQGYFHQYLNADGVQQERYIDADWYTQPVNLVKDEHDQPLKGAVRLGDDDVQFQIWRVNVGRISLYLLDTNLPENSQTHRDITKVLYDPDRDVRIRQEILLGIGGKRALNVLGLHPSAYHINEGHSVFLLLERIRCFMADHDLGFSELKHLVWSSTIFTTHTPVPAGNERFELGLMHKYLQSYVAELNLGWDDFLAFGRENPDNPDESFCMTICALKLAAYVNGVSRLHGDVTRAMWQSLYPRIPRAEIPIGHITNGVHARSWLEAGIQKLMLQGLEAESGTIGDSAMLQNIDNVSDIDLWTTHEATRANLVSFVRARLLTYLVHRGFGASEKRAVRDALDPDTLTIGFARRFASYKRAALLFRNVDRLRQLLCDAERPVQIIIAGKAHPADDAGKEIIRRIFEIAHRPEFRSHIVLLEDYDIEIARYMVQGVDVWLNNPRRPQEASGTSGMKAAMNGALNLSVLDGWWDEAYDPSLGWSIGNGEQYDDFENQDRIEGDLLYHALERDVVPLFYDRDDAGLPREWISMMKNSIREIGLHFNSDRMLKEYTERYYLPAQQLHDRLRADDYAEARAISVWRDKISSRWPQIQIVSVESPRADLIYKGAELEVRAKIRLSDVKAENVIVECYHGMLDMNDEIVDGQRQRMDQDGQEDDCTIFYTTMKCGTAGHYGYTVRILPGHANLAVEFLPELMKWWEEEY
jgi:starch phosphorylase